ncbi:permease prefix domain 1-containing protein [Solwaraspora sp. WMMD1047]|uniref:permease prefix domain 1-containing protein n=1 Tax=Solwaraspora sp. WMMD1047 TaxID=3016102 RepID=UPI002415B0B1|nr:permease prefix domain 1-containing protein [Solwaraspora sp. WMMD1047]MDG4833359.1 permease prefix domain 1-containing protein [Solwaraspora sp. WMMD1047]
MQAPTNTEIDDYLRQLAGELSGPRRLKRDLLTEARGGLEDAALAYTRDGLDPRAARRRAVAEFGAPAELARLYQTELTAGQGRRLALLVALLPAGMLTSDLLWWQPPGGAAERPPTRFLILVETLDWTSYLAGAAALLAFLLLGSASRRRPVDPRLVVRSLAVLTLGTAGFVWTLGTFAAVHAVAEDSRALTWPPMIAAWVLLNTMFALMVRWAVRGVVATRVRPVPA